jgi:hypothetical protein
MIVNNPKKNSYMLMEGGVYGHINHPFDIKSNLTFGDLKSIVTKALNGQLGHVIEKADGYALSVSWIGDKLVAARNKSHLKGFGEFAMNIQDLSNKYSGRNDLMDAYILAMRDLSTAISSIPARDRDMIFKNGVCFLNLEVVYEKSINVIPYGKSLLILHDISEIDDMGNIITKNKKAAIELFKLIKRQNQNIQPTYEIQPTTIRVLPTYSKLKNDNIGYITRISKLQSEFNLSDFDLISNYHLCWWHRFIVNYIKKLDHIHLNGLVRRWALADRSFRLTNIDDIKLRNLIIHFEKQYLDKLYSKNSAKFEKIFIELGSDIISNIPTSFSNNTNAIRRDIYHNLIRAIDSIIKTNDVLLKTQLKSQLIKLKSIGGTKKIRPIEGIIFYHNGDMLKLTGAFGIINKIINMGRYL